MMLECDARIVVDLTELFEKRLGEVSKLIQREAAIVKVQASDAAPVDTGALKNSITAQMVSNTEAVVGASVDYAAYVELRTPFLTPAYEAARARIVDKLRALLEKGADAGEV